MAKKATKTKKCPDQLDFHWGTFCQKILTTESGSEKTLVSIANNLRGALKQDLLEKREFNLSLGQFCVFAVFKRKPEFIGELVQEIDLEMEIPGVESTGSVRLNLMEHQDFGQIQLQFEELQARITLPASKYSHLACVTFKSGNKVLGKVEMPIDVDFTPVRVKRASN